MRIPINAKQTESANVRFLWPTGGRHSDFVYTMKVLIFSSSEIVKTSSELISRLVALMAANHAEVFSKGRILALVPEQSRQME